ncbi:MAG: GYF domain-containing protein [Tepidisphaeraceae bacterium]|jgi:hypothetical protein
MADEWFYTDNGVQAGPVEFSVLQQMAAAGKIQPSELVWKQGMPNWTAAATIPGLFPAAPSPAPASPPPGAVPPPVLQGYPMPMPGARSYFRMARNSMIFSLIGLACFGLFGLGFVWGILGIIFGAMALSGMGTTGDKRGQGMAVIGLVLGIFDLLIRFTALGVYLHRFHR